MSGNLQKVELLSFELLRKGLKTLVADLDNEQHMGPLFQRLRSKTRARIKGEKGRRNFSPDPHECRNSASSCVRR